VNTLSSLICLLVLGGIGASSFAQAQGLGSDPRSTISVTGEGRISAAPDMAEISMGVLSEGESAGAALKANNSSMAALHDVLKQRGVAAKDIQTSNLSIQPRYSQPNPIQQQRGEFVPRIVGYNVTNTVTVQVRDLDHLGELLDAVVTAGANQLYGISFRVDQSQALLDEARKRAMSDAKRKAELLTGEAKVILGQAIHISEGTGSTPPMPKAMFRGMAMAADSVPIASGEQELSVTVSVVYLLLPAP
jgi:uncharacterized protein